MNANDYETFMLPEITSRKARVPERGQSMLMLDRLFWPEKYPVIRMALNGVEPRPAGGGKMANAGVATAGPEKQGGRRHAHGPCGQS
jgi:hypothetical protein